MVQSLHSRFYWEEVRGCMYCVQTFAVNKISVLSEQNCALQKWKCLIWLLVDQKLNKHWKDNAVFHFVYTECPEVCADLAEVDGSTIKYWYLHSWSFLS